MEVKVAEASGRALDALVAMAEGVKEFTSDGITFGFELNGQRKVLAKGWAAGMAWCPSEFWSQGGPLIEREEIGIKRRAPCMKGEEWEATGSITAKGTGYRHAVGPTPLIAAMRCYVMSKLGDEVEVPDELA